MFLQYSTGVTKMESKRCKKCGRPLPDNYGHKKCENCRNFEIKAWKDKGKSAFGIGLIVGDSIISLASKGKISILKKKWLHNISSFRNLKKNWQAVVGCYPAGFCLLGRTPNPRRSSLRCGMAAHSVRMLEAENRKRAQETALETLLLRLVCFRSCSYSPMSRELALLMICPVASLMKSTAMFSTSVPLKILYIPPYM